MFEYIPDFFNLKINVTDILTFAAVILTFFTLKQVKRQRESTYMPDLFIGNRSAKLFGFSLNEAYSDFSFGNIEDTKENDLKEKKYVPWLDLYIHNVGFGAAKYVKGQWEYDFKEFTNQIINVLNEKEFEFNTERIEGVNEFNITHLKSDHFSSGSTYLELEFQQDIILPKNLNDKSPTISLPRTYIDLLSYYISFKYEMFDTNSKKEFIFDELVEIPKLKLRLDYSDIGDKTYSKKLIFEFSMSGKYDEKHRRLDFGEIELGTYHIKIKELKN